MFHWLFFFSFFLSFFFLETKIEWPFCTSITICILMLSGHLLPQISSVEQLEIWGKWQTCTSFKQWVMNSDLRLLEAEQQAGNDFKTCQTFWGSSWSLPCAAHPLFFFLDRLPLFLIPTYLEFCACPSLIAFALTWLVENYSHEIKFYGACF